MIEMKNCWLVGLSHRFFSFVTTKHSVIFIFLPIFYIFVLSTFYAFELCSLFQRMINGGIFIITVLGRH